MCCRTNKAWPSEHVFCSPCAHSYSDNFPSALDNLPHFHQNVLNSQCPCTAVLPGLLYLCTCAFSPAFPLVPQYLQLSHLLTRAGPVGR